MKIAAFDVHQTNKKLLTGAIPVEGVFDDARDSMRNIFGKGVKEGHEFDTPAHDLTTMEMLDRMKKAGDEFHNSIVIAGRAEDSLKVVSYIGNPLKKHEEMAKADKPFANATKDIGARLDGFLDRAAKSKYNDFKAVPGKDGIYATKDYTMQSTAIAPGTLEGKWYGPDSDDSHAFDVDGYNVRVAPRAGAPLIGAAATDANAATFRVLRLTPKVGADGKAALSGGSRVLIAESTMPAVCGTEFGSSNHVEQHMAFSIPAPIGDMKGDAVMSDSSGPSVNGKRVRSTVISCHYRSNPREDDEDSD
jgi:hypothetical protein